MEAAPFVGEQIAPLVNTTAETIAIRESRTAAFGIGSAVAPEATPVLIDLTGREESSRIHELAEMAEQHRISPTRWYKLQSTDENVVAEEARKLIEIGQQMEERARRLTEKWRWDAFSGDLTITYQNNDSVLNIAYPLPSGNKPTVAVEWTDTVNADVVADMKAFRNQIASTAGNPGVVFHLADEDQELILANQKLRAYFNVAVGQPFRPTLDDVAQLVGPGTRFVGVNHGYRLEAAGTATDESAHQRYLPLGKMLVTTEYNNNGFRIAEVPNGRVEVQTGYNTGTLLFGPQSEIKLHGDSMERFLHHKAKRLPALHQPEAFLYATIYTP